MKVRYGKKIIPFFILCLTALLLLEGCGDNSTNSIQPPDFSTVPEPFDTTQSVNKEYRDNGLVIYTIEDSNHPLDGVVPKDQILLFYTGRTADGEVFASSYANGNTSPSRFSNLYPYTVGQSSSLIEGFRLGLMGMKIGEKRTLVIPPSLGYEGARQGTNGYDLRNDTLIYDVELNEILN